MNVNIYVNGSGDVNHNQSEGDKGNGLTLTSPENSNHQDGGGPSAQLTGSSESSQQQGSSDVTDIGAPPQWLHDAISESGSGSETSSSVAASTGGSDGGTAPQL